MTREGERNSPSRLAEVKFHEIDVRAQTWVDMEVGPVLV